ncbi:glycosyltransferase family 2 protein [Bacteroides sp.]|uniref:glycosyltransferase family 2 protein n=1 Tax=Bacteroides sp. TaxID=29523 RepID=UPI001EC9CB10|nr:glycosyltransferase family 2 protein [Bacteroides sp.]MBS5057230.1 glycosyltransferase family 2 protein [Bacteroides sp.]
MNISVVIPLYNKENRIFHTVNSVLNQTFKDFELIIVDDGSTDKSIEIVQIIHDSRIRLIQKENGGPSSARNCGVREAKYDWIIFLDADDEMVHDSLDHFVKLVLANPKVNIFVSNFLFEKNGKRKLHSYFYKDGVVNNNFKSWFFDVLMPCQGSTLYRKTILLENPYSEVLRRYEDAEMFFSLMRTQLIYTSKKPVFIYKLDEAAASKGRKNINEDYLGHLNPRNKLLWEKIVLYSLYKQALQLYPKQAKNVYNDTFDKVELKVIYAGANMVKLILRIITKVLNQFYKPI